MGKWKIVGRCRMCGKIYPGKVPEQCYKCGVVLGRHVHDGGGYFPKDMKFLLPTEWLESVVARKTLFRGWKAEEKGDFPGGKD